jgi:hypothetical protein
MTYQFHATEWYEVKGKSVANVKDNPYLPDLWDPGHLVNQAVEIDGVPYKVIGVETFLINRGPTFPYRLSFGLMVEELDSPSLRV